MESNLTPSLEDYLETICELAPAKKVVRIKDIARARKVRAGSVSPAMQRLADLGYIRYAKREYVELTPSGEKEARRVLSKHWMLARFFREFLQMPDEQAREVACEMEHSLSRLAMDRLVRFFEFLAVCPTISKDFIDRFHRCPVIHPEQPPCDLPCEARLRGESEYRAATRSLSELTPGESGTVVQVNSGGAIRQRLLDMGILPNEVIRVERVAPAGGPVWIRVRGYQLSLRRNEADAVIIEEPH